MTDQKPSPDDQSNAARQEVERAAQHYYYTPQQMGIDNRTKQLVVERCEPYILGPKVLDLGYVDGLWTDRLVEKGYAVDIVEGASRHIEHARQRYAGVPTVRIYHQLFQEFRPDTLYDTIIAGDMLRYLPDPPAFLKEAVRWLNPTGHFIVTIPNRRSMHRRIGVYLGMEESLSEANQRDQEVGNLRSYDRYELRSLLLQSGYHIKTLRGCFLKPLTSAQMQDWSDDLLQAFLLMGDELEDYCWFLYAVCMRGDQQSG